MPPGYSLEEMDDGSFAVKLMSHFLRGSDGSTKKFQRKEVATSYAKEHARQGLTYHQVVSDKQ